MARRGGRKRRRYRNFQSGIPKHAYYRKEGFFQRNKTKLVISAIVVVALLAIFYYIGKNLPKSSDIVFAVMVVFFVLLFIFLIPKKPPYSAQEQAIYEAEKIRLQAQHDFKRGW